MGVKKSNLLLWVATTLDILSRGRGTKKVKNRWTSPTTSAEDAKYHNKLNIIHATLYPKSNRPITNLCEYFIDQWGQAFFIVVNSTRILEISNALCLL